MTKKHPVGNEEGSEKKQKDATKGISSIADKTSKGKTPEYKEYQEKSKGRTKEEELALHERMMDIFAQFGAVRDVDPASEEAQMLVQKLRDFITEHMYTCSKEILSNLGKMYDGGGDFTTNINKFAGEGTAEFASAAIEAYCGK